MLALNFSFMKKGFYWIIGTQFLSSFADNALLIVAIALLQELHAPGWATPMLKFTFVVSYVLLAAFVATFADSRPKGQVMFITNLIKIAGLLLMVFWIHPLLAYGVVGFGAAAYSPAKYGILTELLPAEKLVVANGWIEGTTVASIVLGMGTGGLLVRPDVANFLFSLNLPGAKTASQAALWAVLCIYLLATLCNTRIPDTGVRYPKADWRLNYMVNRFSRNVHTLWHDKLGQISLAMTTLFWGAGATLQFIVLIWAKEALDFSLSDSSWLLGIVAIGIAIGAISAAATVPLKKALKVMVLGAVMGAACILLAFYNKDYVPHHISFLGLPLYLWLTCIFLIIVGALGGFFMVPMNALLQHRGHVRLTAGQSIAVQNFNENIGILVMLALYALLIRLHLSVQTIMVLFGLLVAGITLLVMKWNKANMKERDWTELIGEEKKPHHV